MKCMYCECQESKVIDTRPTDEGIMIRRRRECMGCGKRFTTYERIENVSVLVEKSDGRREYFDPEKLRYGIIKACEKRPVSMEVIDQTVGDIEKMVYNSMDKEVTSKFLGEIVMGKIKQLDEVAYVRFASVYKSFKDIDEFIAELDTLLKEKSLLKVK